jgi:hypothetical protein
VRIRRTVLTTAAAFTLLTALALGTGPASAQTKHVDDPLGDQQIDGDASTLSDATGYDLTYGAKKVTIVIQMKKLSPGVVNSVQTLMLLKNNPDHSVFVSWDSQSGGSASGGTGFPDCTVTHSEDPGKRATITLQFKASCLQQAGAPTLNKIRPLNVEVYNISFDPPNQNWSDRIETTGWITHP